MFGFCFVVSVVERSKGDDLRWNAIEQKAHHTRADNITRYSEYNTLQHERTPEKKTLEKIIQEHRILKNRTSHKTA